MTGPSNEERTFEPHGGTEFPDGQRLARYFLPNLRAESLKDVFKAGWMKKVKILLLTHPDLLLLDEPKEDDRAVYDYLLKLQAMPYASATKQKV